MTRYFYTDPLAAAWQAKHFGMRFIRRTTSEEGTYDEDGIEMETRHFFAHANYVPNADISHVYLVHPESLGLLEPKVGDKVSYSFGVGQHAGEAWDEVKGVIAANDEGYPYTGNGEPYVLVDGGDEFPLSRLREILHRDGKPFMWPESEAA